MARDDQGDRFERIISQRLAAGRNDDATQCPDASILAAYRERILARDESTRYERHLAQCARCSSALAALARIEETTDRDAAVAHPRAAREDHHDWWRVGNVLPLAAIAAMVALVIVVALRPFATPRSAVVADDRKEPPTRSLASDAAPVTTKSRDDALRDSNSMLAMNQSARAKSAPSAVSEPSARKASQSQKEAGSPEREQAPDASRDALAEKAADARELDKQKREVAGAPAGNLPTAAPLAPPALPGVAPSASSSASASAPAMTLEPAEKASLPAAPAAPTAIPKAATGGSVGGLAAGSGGARAALSDQAATPGVKAMVIEAPDHTTLWMVGAHGSISRYSEGTGWVPLISGVNADLTAGSARSGTICWIVGRDGTILRTADGEHWTTVVAPVREDLIEVNASSATAATISTASGHRFETTDGGVTWRPLR
ncbi:MAG TPA: hypothetical protein VHS07_05035 [Candidatus Binataceae bacterium]|nr:hypothetical protein [Candidatus Binataceae bacterium]